MSGDHATAPSPDRVAVDKAARRLIPFLFLLYIVAYLDRINVSFAALHMNRDIGLSAAAYGLGAGIFFLGYVLFEIPSNLILARVGPRFWIARIMVTWGLVSMAMAGVWEEFAFYFLRFLLGLAEAGFFPGIILYLTHWFPSEERARIVALFMTATAVAGLVGSPVSGTLLGLHSWLGLAGWQWLFLLEGAPAVLLGGVVWFRLPEHPRQAAWLTETERATLLARLDIPAAPGPRTTGAALTSPVVWRLGLTYLTLVVGMYGVGMWLPQMVQDALGGTDLQVGFLTAVPYLAAAAGMVWLGRRSDRQGERRLHTVFALLAAACGLVGAALSPAPLPGFLALCLAAVGIWGALGPFWAQSTAYLPPAAAAAGIALINAVGNVGGFLGPTLMGWLREATVQYTAGLLALAAILTCGAALAALPLHRNERPS